jgi:uncharacterized membrane protein YdbT with pleckstrin-like domain
VVVILAKGRSNLANYVETIVGPGEQVLYVGKVSLFSILPALIGGTLLILVGGAFAAGAGPVGLIFGVLGLIVILVALIRRNSTELAVTNRRVIAKFGFIKRSTIELNLAKVESIRVEQSIGGRLFGYGSVIVTGTGSTMDPIPYVADPIKFRQAVQSATDVAQKV